MITKSTKTLAGVAAIAIVLLATPSPANAGAADLSTARAATAQFHDIDVAIGAGYGLLRDKDGIACIDNPAGVMGIHYVKGSLVGDAAVDPATPEALVYQQLPNGKLRLVAVEYVVFQGAWDLEHSSPPSLFGQQFLLVRAPNRYGLPPFYERHAWIWKDNPSGLFSDWNPRGACGPF